MLDKETRARFYRKKYNLMTKSKRLGARYSALFRAVKLGDQLHMGDVYDILHDTVKLGKEIEGKAHEAADAGLQPEVFADLSTEAWKLRTFAAELRKVSETYFGFPVRTLPVYEPEIRREKAMADIQNSLAGLVRDLEQEDDNE